jgi:WD40 repeat protein
LKHECAIVSHRTEGPLSWSPDGTLLASPQSGSQVDLWDATTNRPVVSYHTPDIHEIKALGWSPDGKLLVASGRRFPYGRAIVQIWEVTALQKEAS